MKKFIIISFVFVMLLSLSAMASETRVRTMGENNNVLLDDANIWLYPSRILDYPNLATAELGYDDNEFDQLGVNWKLDDESVLGTYFSTRSRYYDYYETSSYYGNADERIDVFYGTNLSGNRFGVHLNFAQNSTKYENDTINIPSDPYFNGSNGNSENGASYANLTVGLTEASGQWDVALNFGFGSFSDINDTGFAETEPDGINNIALYGRYFQIKNPNYTLIHHVRIFSEKYGEKDNFTNISVVDKNVGFDIGSGFNFTPSSHVLGVFDLGIMYTKSTTEVTGATNDPTTKNFTLPYFKMGFDGEVFKWLDVRFGSTSYWDNRKIENGDVTYTRKYADNMTYFGLGFNWNNLHVDTEANPDFFLAGPDFLSGAGEDMAWKLSVTYDM